MTTKSFRKTQSHRSQIRCSEENETLQSKFMIAENTSTTLSINHKKLSDRIIEMERITHRLYGTFAEDFRGNRS